MSETDYAMSLAESIAENAVLWGEDDDGNDVPMGFDVNVLRTLVDAAVKGSVRRALVASAEEIRAELVCCDVFERLHEKRASDHTEEQKASRRMHSICYWGEASARLVSARADAIYSPGPGADQ